MKRAKRRSSKRVPWQPLKQSTRAETAKRAGVRPPAWMEEFWENSVYLVFVASAISEELGPMTQLLIQRKDGRCIRNWAHLQKIKNEICGPERVAVEVFPAESGLVDKANFYHLWVLHPMGKLGISLHGVPCEGIPEEKKEEEGEVEGR